MNHTPEPWEWHVGHEPHCQSQIYDTDGRTIAVFYNDEGGHNAERATNCVNALAGRNPEALARVEVALCCLLSTASLSSNSMGTFSRLRGESEHLRQQCEILRAALAEFRGEMHT